MTGRPVKYYRAGDIDAAHERYMERGSYARTAAWLMAERNVKISEGGLRTMLGVRAKMVSRKKWPSPQELVSAKSIGDFEVGGSEPQTKPSEAKCEFCSDPIFTGECREANPRAKIAGEQLQQEKPSQAEPDASKGDA